MTFAKACSHITNYTSGHETHRNNPERFPVYPDNHIEVDSHLSGMLGQLGQQYREIDKHGGATIYYVHLWREPLEVAESFLRRPGAQRMAATMFQFAGQLTREQWLEHMYRLAEISYANISYFLQDKRLVRRYNIDQAADNWPEFWKWIEAEGDMEAAKAEFNTHYNASPR